MMHMVWLRYLCQTGKKVLLHHSITIWCMVKTRPDATPNQRGLGGTKEGQQSDVSHKKSTRRERGVRRLSSTSFFDDKDERAFSIGLTRGRG
jgi:hypothetical protein